MTADILCLQTHRETDRFFTGSEQEFRLWNLPVTSSTTGVLLTDQVEDLSHPLSSSCRFRHRVPFVMVLCTSVCGSLNTQLIL